MTSNALEKRRCNHLKFRNYLHFAIMTLGNSKYISSMIWKKNNINFLIKVSTQVFHKAWFRNLQRNSITQVNSWTFLHSRSFRDTSYKFSTFSSNFPLYNTYIILNSSLSIIQIKIYYPIHIIDLIILNHLFLVQPLISHLFIRPFHLFRQIFL